MAFEVMSAGPIVLVDERVVLCRLLDSTCLLIWVEEGRGFWGGREGVVYDHGHVALCNILLSSSDSIYYETLLFAILYSA